MNSTTLKQSIADFLTEDIGLGDITTEAIFAPEQQGSARFIARHSFIACGMGKIAGQVFAFLDPDIQLQTIDDGAKVNRDDILLEVKGSISALLQGERVALNLVQRLCGIATMTSRFVKRVQLLPVKIVDTRKTTPGLRMLEKYAVRVGGGNNHRLNLADGILIKDNHIASCGSIQQAVKQVRERAPHTLKIEVESDTLDQVKECLACGVEIIMLDNMDIEQMKEAVQLIKGRALVEASGGITLDNIRNVAETGVNLISIGALTHSAPACDISMELTL